MKSTALKHLIIMGLVVTFMNTVCVKDVYAEYSCSRCSTVNGCEWTMFQSNDQNCSTVIPNSATRMTGCNCMAQNNVSGNDARCAICPATKLKTPSLLNATTYLTLPTYHTGGEVQPDVLILPNNEFGFRYWMTLTYYENSMGNLIENLSVLASQDGLSWIAPGNLLIAPVDDKIYAQSDSDIIMVNNKLYVYYRVNDKTRLPQTMRLQRVSSSDGKSWSPPENTSVFLTDSGKMASPAIIYTEGSYYLFYVNTISDTTVKEVRRMSSVDGLNWTNDQVLFTFPNAWHLDVIKYQGHYLMLLAERYLPPASDIGARLHYLTSEDMINWIYQGVALSPSSSGWDSTNIYRSGFLISGLRFRVWYSAYQGSIPHIGYVEDANWTYSDLPNMPSCKSWTDVYINSCSSNADFQNNSNGCITDTTNINLHVNGTHTPTTMKILNVPDYNIVCGDLTGNEANWSQEEVFSINKTWQLSAGQGDKKVCVQLKNNDGWGIPCGAGIHLRDIPPGDLDGDTHVNDADFQLFIPDFGKTGSPGFISSDINKNGKVDIFDYNVLVGNFGK